MRLFKLIRHLWKLYEIKGIEDDIAKITKKRNLLIAEAKALTSLKERKQAELEG